MSCELYKSGMYAWRAGSNAASFQPLFDHLAICPDVHYIKDSLSFLRTNTSGAASAAFSPDGKFLVVTERLTNNIDVFRVLADGTLSSIVINSTAGSYKSRLSCQRGRQIPIYLELGGWNDRHLCNSER
jgi:hypothetical protein